MRGFLAVAALAVGMLSISATPTPAAAEPPVPFTWMPEVAPQGPVLIVIGLDEQRAVVYRNGVRIGSSPVSTGKEGHETPTGIFNILQKRREHNSNLYNNAPMPFMQRLTWDGIALHAGHLPGYPASHGCVRLPYEFSEALFGITERGMTVVVAQSLGQPQLQSPEPLGMATPSTGASPDSRWTWQPERMDQGPVTMVLSIADQQLVVMRGGVEIGRGDVAVDAPDVHTQAYAVMGGTPAGESRLVPGRPALNWMRIPIQRDLQRDPLEAGSAGNVDAAGATISGGAVRIDPEFAKRVHEALAPGSTLLVTPEPVSAVSNQGMTVFESAPRPQQAPEPAHE